MMIAIGQAQEMEIKHQCLEINEFARIASIFMLKWFFVPLYRSAEFLVEIPELSWILFLALYQRVGGVITRIDVNLFLLPASWSVEALNGVEAGIASASLFLSFFSVVRSTSLVSSWSRPWSLLISRSSALSNRHRLKAWMHLSLFLLLSSFDHVFLLFPVFSFFILLLLSLLFHQGLLLSSMFSFHLFLLNDEMLFVLTLLFFDFILSFFCFSLQSFFLLSSVVLDLLLLLAQLHLSYLLLLVNQFLYKKTEILLIIWLVELLHIIVELVL